MLCSSSVGSGGVWSAECVELVCGAAVELAGGKAWRQCASVQTGVKRTQRDSE